LIVVTLLGLVAATVTSRIGGSLDQAAMGRAVTQWEFTDQQLRLKARRSGRPVALHLDVGTNRLECEWEENAATRTVHSLGRGVKLARYLSSTQEETYGPARIRYSCRGTTETFVVELVGKRSRWLLVAGLTGQISEIADETKARELLEQLSRKSVHAG
jgi:hypothetical protein